MFEVSGISFSYARNQPLILDNVGFSAGEGEIVAVLGNNGAGKSTLIKCINRILTPRSGAVHVHGESVFDMSKTETAKRIAYVPQATKGTANMTVFDTILMGRRPFIQWDVTDKDREMVFDLIDTMGLQEFTLRNVARLSGGEAQKVMLARALAQEPRVLLLDEPTSNLDPFNQHETLHTVNRIAKENNTVVVLVIHDLNLAIRYADRFLFLKNSTVHAYGGSEVMTEENLATVYGIHTHIIRHRGLPVVVPIPEYDMADTGPEKDEAGYEARWRP